MKPTLQFQEIHHRREPRTSRRAGVALPKTDYNYQPSVPGDFSGGRGGDSRTGSFRAISADYFAHDARTTFAWEGSLFVVMVLIVAVPVVEGARGLMQVVQAAGGL